MTRLTNPLQRGRLIAPALLLALHLAGCATPPMTNALSNAPPEYLPQQIELTSTPFFPQQAYQCGPAALATVLNYRDRTITPQQLTDKVYLPKRQGSLQAEIKAQARQAGLLAYPLAPSLQDLLQEVAAGNPVLVLQNLALDWTPQWHYAVVVGYNLPEERIILRSGTHRRHINDFALFERTWARADYWALVLLEPESLPVTAKPLPLLQGAHELEQVGQSAAALKAYRAAVQRWPDQGTAWLTLGNRLYSDGDIEGAVGALQQATRNSGNAGSWNNYAYALQELGCHTAAVKAIRCAMTRAPSDRGIQKSAEEIESAPNVDGRPADCPVVKCP